MMTHAYHEMYLDDAMQTLAEVFSYVDNENDANILFNYFVMSGIAHQFGSGNPKYLNMPSHALFYEICGNTMELIKPEVDSRSKEYWCGYVLAYYQWYTGLSFMEIGKFLPPSKIISMYSPLHEAPIEKFVEIANSIVLRKETRLAMYRKNANLSQNDLARLSGVSLRSIQLYEQRKLDINYANAIRLYKLSKVLGCNMEDLIERGQR